MTDLLGPGAAGAARTLTTTTDVTNPAVGDTFYQDCVAGTPGTGTPIMAQSQNKLLQQVRRVIRNAGVTLNNADDDMLWKAIIASQATGTFRLSRRVLCTTTQTITLTAKETQAFVQVWGAGGGGGGTYNGTTISQAGGSGEYREGWLTGLSGSYTATVGAGGAGGLASASPTAGSAGGDSSFGGIVAKGGGGGNSSSSGAATPLTNGGTGGSAGDFVAPGASGGNGFQLQTGAMVYMSLGPGSWGMAQTPWGSSSNVSTSGANGLYPGQGGGASISQANGGSGYRGLIIVWIYATA